MLAPGHEEPGAIFVYVTSKAVERAVALLDVLSTHQLGLDRDQIRDRVPDYRRAGSVGAFERMFERDKQVVRALGVELVATRADYSPLGFVYRLQQVSVATAEFSAVDVAVLSHCTRAWDGTELERLARSALLKIGASTGQRLGGQLGEPPRFSAPPGVAECLMALAEGKAVSFTYDGAGQSGSEVRKVLCWGLGLRFGHWYLMGWDKARRSRRLFRLDRMAAIHILTIDGPPVPDDFSMERELAALPSQILPLVATVRVSELVEGEDAGSPVGGLDRALKVEKSFGVLESARSAVLNGRTHCIDRTLWPDVAPVYQAQIIEVERGLREELLAWHIDAVGVEAPQGEGAWKPVVPQRNRESASDQLIRLLLMLSLVESAGSLPLATLADFFLTTEAKAQTQLEGLAASVGFESLTVDIDTEGNVTVSGNQALVSGVRLTAAESLVLSLALDLAASADSGSYYGHLHAKLWPDTREVSGAAQPARQVAVYGADVDPAITRALSERVPLRITYRSRRGTSKRVVEPEALLIDNGPRYLRAWCRQAGDYRTFDLHKTSDIELLDGQAFSPRAENGGGPLSSPRLWLQELANGAHPVPTLTLAVPKSLPAAHRERTQAVLTRYATASAEETDWVFYRLPLVHTSWALSLLIELGPTVRVLEPQALRLELLSLLRASPTANSQ